MSGAVAGDGHDRDTDREQQPSPQREPGVAGAGDGQQVAVVAPPFAATESLAAAPWPRGRTVVGVDVGRVAVLAPPVMPLKVENRPSPLGKAPVAAIWLRAMSVQFWVWFRQWVTSQSMAAGFQTFQKSACMEN